MKRCRDEWLVLTETRHWLESRYHSQCDNKNAEDRPRPNDYDLGECGRAMKERLQEYALLAEIIGGIAIVASLIFVGFQVQQAAEETALNTRQMQADAYQDLVSQITSLNQLGVTNPQVNVLANSGADLEDMNDEERAMVNSLIIMMFRMSDMAYNQYEQGMISEERLTSAVGPLSDNICNPIYGTIWSEISKNFVSSYSGFVSNLLSNCE